MSVLREARLEDSSEINKISRFLGYANVLDEVANDRLKNLLSSKLNCVWVYENENGIVGWIHIFHASRVASEGFIEIGGLVVNPQYRREGIGRTLVEHAKEYSRSQGLKLRVRFNSKREEVHRFYQSIGFSCAKSQYVFESS